MLLHLVGKISSIVVGVGYIPSLLQVHPWRTLVLNALDGFIIDDLELTNTHKPNGEVILRRFFENLDIM